MNNLFTDFFQLPRVFKYVCFLILFIQVLYFHNAFYLHNYNRFFCVRIYYLYYYFIPPSCSPRIKSNWPCTVIFLLFSIYPNSHDGIFDTSHIFFEHFFCKFINNIHFWNAEKYIKNFSATLLLILFLIIICVSIPLICFTE